MFVYNRTLWISQIVIMAISKETASKFCISWVSDHHLLWGKSSIQINPLFIVQCTTFSFIQKIINDNNWLPNKNILFCYLFLKRVISMWSCVIYLYLWWYVVSFHLEAFPLRIWNYLLISGLWPNELSSCLDNHQQLLAT